ncbi:MAG TPA: AAA family ATPase, partial [Candidatus Elarobacter sp.]|nr:AAA family ATPase [Candidatus Elarobacter sp.]
MLCRPFIGRREELAYLHELRRGAASSKGGLVSVVGDAGLGKSRLIGEFCNALTYARYRIARAACTEFAGQPYGPVLDVLARLEGERRELEPAASQREQIQSMVARIAALAARSALVVVIEDVHWADTATLDFLAQLAPKLRAMRAMAIVSFRPEALHPEHPASAALHKVAREQAGRIDLAPLAGAELQTFVREALAEVSLTDEARRRIARAGEGNPFFTEELLKSAVAESATRKRGTRFAVPPTIADTLLERLKPFDEQERHVIGQAAVIGRAFHLDLLATTLGVDAETLLPVLRRARDVQLIEELGPMAFRFRHGLTREAIYGNYLASEVRPLHRTVALTLERTPEATSSTELLAYHFWAAGDAERSVRYNELAGDAASRVFAHEDAIAFYERAIASEIVDRMTYASILEKIAERRIALTWTEQAQATFAAAADVFRDCGAHEREAECRVHAAILAYTTNKPHPTRALEAMLTRLDDAEYLARSRVHLGIAWLAATFGFPTRAAQHIAHVDARAVAEAPDIGLRVHNVAAWVAMTVGDYGGFRREHAAWLTAAEASASPRAALSALVNGAMCYSFFARHDEALRYIDRALARAHDARNESAEESCHAFAVLCHLARGDLERAKAALEHVSPASENHVNFTFGSAWGTLAGAYTDDARVIATWFDGFDAAGPRTMEVECGAGFSEVLVRRGRRDEAARLLHRVLPDCEMVRGNIDTLLAVARYGLPADRSRARTYLERGAAAPVELPERAALALFDAIESRRAGRDEEAVAHASVAAAGFRRLEMPLLEAAALEAAGAVDDALALYRRCGASYDVRRLGGDAAGVTEFAADE